MDQSLTDTTSSSNSSVYKGTKKRLRRDKWEQNQRKRCRASGRGYVTAKNKIDVPAKKFVYIVNCCKNECHEKLNSTIQKEKFKAFHKLGKEEQDTFLMSCVVKITIQRASKNPATKNRECSWQYSVPIDTNKQKVCKTFLQKLFQVSDERMKTVLRFCKVGALVATENRGHHQNRPRTTTNEIWEMIKNHWDSFPSKGSHYSHKKTNRKYFDNPDLNVKILYDLFKENYKTKTGKDLSLSYSAYFKFFQKNSPFSFRSPKTDICDFCAKCSAKLAINPNDSCKTVYESHLKKVKEYNELRKKYIFEKNDKNKSDKEKVYQDTLVLEFDYAQNLTLPKLNINSNYYKRVLNLYVFNIHCFNDNHSKMYTYLESDGKKDSNSVCSFLDNFIKIKLSENQNFKKIILFSDSAGGQNKNSHVVKFCTRLAQTYKTEITQVFPVRGHSYCQCDRNFGLYGKILKRKQRIESPEEYLDIIRSARLGEKPFEVELSGDIIKNWTAALTLMYTNTPKLKKIPFTIQKYVKIRYNQTSEVFVYTGYNSDYLRFSNVPKKNVPLQLSTISKPGINAAKKKDMEYFLPFLNQEVQNWLSNVIHDESNSEQDDVISDEESDREDEN